MIDAHFHLWQLDRGDYGWLTPALAPIYRDVHIDHWRTESRPCGITGGVLVQAAPTEAETLFLLDQAHNAADVLGVVGWLDLLAPTASARIAALSLSAPKLKGLRPMLQDITDPDWILQPALAPALETMAACGLVFDGLVKPVHLPRIVELARRHPNLRIVIDHGAKPDIAHGQWQAWADGLAQIARETKAVCKLSGLWTEAASADAHGDGAVLKRYGEWVLDTFGHQRCLWGSDWPVLELAGDYARWLALARSWVPAEQQARVFGGTAVEVYRLQR
ncbi:amidohydrolase family protein [Variovorax sp. HJSM1_2]|uniref:amidohydrolase family protein n=1 Tax=Variovorax sp. HJSM1_2 TaxID=3366263 RepID=UPI003BC2F46D